MKNLLAPKRMYLFYVFPVVLLFCLLSCKDDNSETGPGQIESGNWTATMTTGFGSFDFIVNSESTHIGEFSITLNGTLGNTTFNGSSFTTRSTPGWQITDRGFSFSGNWNLGSPPFESEILTITIDGSFSEKGDAADGNWNADFDGSSDSGEWTANPSGN